MKTSQLHMGALRHVLFGLSSVALALSLTTSVFAVSPPAAASDGEETCESCVGTPLAMDSWGNVYTHRQGKEVLLNRGPLTNQIWAQDPDFDQFWSYKPLFISNGIWLIALPLPVDDGQPSAGWFIFTRLDEIDAYVTTDGIDTTTWKVCDGYLGVGEVHISQAKA